MSNADHGFVLVPSPLLKTLSDELEHWVYQVYVSERTGKCYPEEQGDFDEAMKPVNEARALISAGPSMRLIAAAAYNEGLEDAALHLEANAERVFYGNEFAEQVRSKKVP